MTVAQAVSVRGVRLQPNSVCLLACHDNAKVLIWWTCSCLQVGWFSPMVAARAPVVASAAGSGGGDGKLPWCEPEALLASLYGFTHMSCSSLQDDQSVRGFLGLLARFVKSLRVREQLGCRRRMGGACK